MHVFDKYTFHWVECTSLVELSFLLTLHLISKTWNTLNFYMYLTFNCEHLCASLGKTSDMLKSLNNKKLKMIFVGEYVQTRHIQIVDQNMKNFFHIKEACNELRKFTLF